MGPHDGTGLGPVAHCTSGRSLNLPLVNGPFNSTLYVELWLEEGHHSPTDRKEGHWHR